MKPFPILAALFLTPVLLCAAPPQESDYYSITTFNTPDGAAMEVGSIELLPDNKLALGTRRGEIWTVSNAQDADPSKVKYQLFASGQHEVLGLAYKDGSLYATNRYEVLRLKDEDNDGRADLFETVCDQWGVSGDYHEYAFGSRFDKNGDLWVTLCLTGSFSSNIDFRGWAMRIKPDGTMVPTCSGIRSPGGIGFDADGEVYYTDNQGPWHGACTLQHLIPGSFQGHPGGFKWYDKAPNMGPRPVLPHDNSRMVTERERIKELIPPAVYMVHGKIGNSSSFIVCDLSKGKFGPFETQLFIADQSHSNISRVFLEEVNGIKQGVVFPFLKGFKSGLIGGRMNDQGQLFAGGSDRGWGSKGGKPFDFERVQWTGKVPFEVHEMHAKPDGFELSFTEPVDERSAADPATYSMREFTYSYREEYGGPEIADVVPKITKAVVSADKKSVRLTIEPLTKGHIHELHLDGLKSAQNQPLVHAVGYYTLNEIPKN
ncbi:MAG: putative rane-bound dehydrogenase domain protein [Chthoniobacteraceae bacterium]|nr:putative rane-bound dehydrogenase domain protein [Chthoniobacteraceae bacterium]